MPLRIRRGTNAERLTVTPLEGELVYTTDTKKLFVGDGTTVGGIGAIASAPTPLNPLQENINLNGYSITGTGTINTVGNIGNGKLLLNLNTISSTETYIAPGSGKSIGILKLGNAQNLLKVTREWEETTEPLEEHFGITNGFVSLVSNNYSSRGTINSPLTVQSGDCLSYNKVFGHDGFDYVESSSIWHGVDPFAPITPGIVPGAIAFLTTGTTGQHIVSFDSRGRFGINKFPQNATQALDVVGNGVFSGIVEAAGFKGSIFGDDSTLIINGIDNTISTGTLTLKGNSITSSNGFIGINKNNSTATAALDVTGNGIFSGDLSANNLSISGSQFTSGQVWGQSFSSFTSDPTIPVESQFGVSLGYVSLQSVRYASRTSLTSPTALNPFDSIAIQTNYGHDGANYALSSYIWYGVDPNGGSIGGGFVPGLVNINTVGHDGIKVLSFDSRGFLGVNIVPTVPLEVNGRGIFHGDVSASSFKGSLVGDDSTIIVNGIDNTVTASTVISGGFIMFGHYTTTQRNQLTASNGMVIYNTTDNKFQGYQNGGWINLDNGSSAP